jgi:two-component system nitrogen regulation response regulator NtrX
MILVIDDEKYIRSSLSGLLDDEGYKTTAVESAEKGEKFLQSQDIDLILLDIQMPGKDGLTFLEDNRSDLQGIPVIIISGRGDIPTAVSAIKLGAYDYIEKPLNPERVLLTITQAIRLSQSLKAEKKLVGHILDRYRIIGRSQAITQVEQMITKAAAIDAAILITGENGTGKELVAYHVHYRSNRKAEPMVAVNCPAIAEQLFESELFGHVKGAFTGAGMDRIGRFEKAHGGTLFLDEIGELPLSLQPKLLRVLETGRFEKVGSDETMSVDCRLISATNRNLKDMIEKSKFREDLFYRLNVVTVNVPPLDSRPDDIPLLVDHFLGQMNVDNEYAFSSEAIGAMASYDWPGNIRQLKNFVHQVVFGCEPGTVGVDDVSRVYYNQQDIESYPAGRGESGLTAAIRQFEIGYLSRLYQKHNGNISATARELNMDRGNLSKKLRQLKIV